MTGGIPEEGRTRFFERLPKTNLKFTRPDAPDRFIRARHSDHAPELAVRGVILLWSNSAPLTAASRDNGSSGRLRSHRNALSIILGPDARERKIVIYDCNPKWANERRTVDMHVTPSTRAAREHPVAENLRRV